MTVCDTSVWIAYFNGVITAETNHLDELLEDGKILMLDIILLELLQGFRNDKHYKQALRLLTQLPVYAAMNPQSAIRIADHYRKLRKKGITIRKTIDMMIAVWCMEQDVTLLHDDKDYTLISDHLSLKTVRV